MDAHPAIARRSSAPNTSAAGANSNDDIAANVSDAAATEEATAEAAAAAIIAASSKPPVFKQKNRLRSKSLTKIKALKAMDGRDGSRGRRMSRDKAHPSLVPKQRYVTSTTVERCRSRGTLEKVKRSHPKDGNLMQIRQQPGDTSRRASSDGEAGSKYYRLSLTAPAQQHHPTAPPPYRPTAASPSSTQLSVEEIEVNPRARTAPESPTREPFFMQLAPRPPPAAAPSLARGGGPGAVDGTLFAGSSQKFGQCPFCMVIFKGQHKTCAANFGVTAHGQVSPERAAQGKFT